MAGSGEVVSHWYHGFENYNTSAREFYASVEEAVKRRGIPDVEFSRVDHAEGGILSAKREYLRVARGKLVFDICAAPFGKGYFFSWWLTKQSGNVLFALIGLMSIVVVPIVVTSFLAARLRVPFLLAILAIPLLWWLSANIIRTTVADFDDLILSIPYLGPIWQVVFRPETFFKVDTTLMYQEAVRGAVMEALDQLVSQQGLRALSPEERLPKMRDLAR